ncbi:MAG TPA: PEP-CTERM sorting domain-containing protein [Candidatus Angelobacter sp.]|nr:PEP-CTERM sorting domain-containing protein [Candidatus Angelobacter sp.]
MRNKLLVVGLLLIAFSFPAYADTFNYTINFTTSFGPGPTSGSFTYDSSTGTFSNFVVVWDGYSFDLTSSANSTFLHSSGCTGEASTGAYSLELLSQTLTCPSGPEYFWAGQPRVGPTQAFLFDAVVSGGAYDQIGTSVPATGATDSSEGNWTISAVTTPEPSALLLLGSGLLSIMGVGRRWKQSA